MKRPALIALAGMALLIRFLSLDVEVGRQLRKQIYEPADSRDAMVSIEAFLGRPHCIQPFLKELGIWPD